MEKDFSPKYFNRKKNNFCEVDILGSAEGKVEKIMFHYTEEI
jgi:hypothetical protein